MLPTTAAAWIDKVQQVSTFTAQNAPLPQIDAHEVMAAAQSWAHSNDDVPPPQVEGQSEEQQATTTITIPTTTMTVGDFAWQPTTMTHHDRPNAVVYQVVDDPQGDLSPCREWVF
jgi:hypothetical protein